MVINHHRTKMNVLGSSDSTTAISIFDSHYGIPLYLLGFTHTKFQGKGINVILPLNQEAIKCYSFSKPSLDRFANQNFNREIWYE